MLQFSSAQLAAWAGALFWPLVRVLALVGTAPLLSHRAVPMLAKAALGVAIAALLAPAVDSPPLVDPLGGPFLRILAINLLAGAALGFAVRLVFAGVELAGELIGLQIGMSFGGFFSPEASQTDNPVGNFVALLVLMIFLSIDGHLMMLSALRQSFDLIPADASAPLPLGFDAIARGGAEMFSIALSISLPMLAVMLLINVVLGVMARVAPQLNLFAVGFPVTLAAGLGVLFLFLPYLEAPIRTVLERALANWPG
jgi:flagellar biosynthetic protein FliR